MIFPFACFPCFMITGPFILSHYSSKHWYKNSLLLINPRLRKLKPVNIPILFLGRPRSVAALRQALGVDRKRLYTYKGGILGGFKPCSLKIGTSVDEDIECQP